MSEYIYGTDEHSGHWLTGERIVRCRDCMYARESYWDDGERKHADPMSKLCGYFGGKITVPLDFYCKAGERKVDGE